MTNSTISRDSKIKDVYANPIGRDIIDKILLQLNISNKLLTNPLIGNIKLRTLPKIAGKMVDESFVTALITLLNNEHELPMPYQGAVNKKWWKEAVVYQIYPRSFNDSNGDGIGDINGITDKLSYLKNLGVDIIWLSPVYDSPNDDNGYDIRDYRKIMSEFGTMDDFDRLLREVHALDMKLIMDLVVNHTSDEHEWFVNAKKDKNSKYRDYYIWKKSFDSNPPNNWTSFFSGPAWSYDENSDEWYLHLFSKKQPDLNWDNPDVRKEVQNIVTFWLKKGVDGFRLDVINYISKLSGLPDGSKTVGEMMGFYGIENYFYGPHLNEYLRELRANTFDKHNTFTVGETPGVGMQMSRLLTSEFRRELDTVFCFDILETPGHVRFDDYMYDLNFMKKYYINYMKNYTNDCWMSLFIENHDNPRMISKINPDNTYRVVIGKLLAMIELTLKGTTFIFQGQELGLINKSFTSINQLRDVESINMYNELIKTMPEDKAFEKILCGTRDHARTPMPWDDSENSGFSSVTPWIYTDDDYKQFNAETEINDEESVYNFYRKLIAIRKSDKALIYGDLEVMHENMNNLFTYFRTLDNKKYYIECNLCENTVNPHRHMKNLRLILSNYNTNSTELRPYEANLYEVI